MKGLLCIFSPMLNFKKFICTLSVAAAMFTSLVAVTTAHAEEYTYYHTPAEAKAYVDNFLKTSPKDAFVPMCAEKGAEYVGAAQAKKTCGCAYDRLLDDIPRFTEMVRLIEDLDNPEWLGYEFFIECAPEQFNAEMEKALTKACIEKGMPQKVCPCIAKSVVRDYSPRDFLEIAVYDRAGLTGMLAAYSARCMIFN